MTDKKDDKEQISTEPGVVYKSNEPEFVGKIPVKQELKVNPADEPEQLKGWTTYERRGGDVYLLDDEEMPISEPLKNKDDLVPGMKIIAPTLLGSVIAEVKKDDEHGELYWESGGSIGDLIFGEDSRKCWITTYAVNKKLLKKISLSS